MNRIEAALCEHLRILTGYALHERVHPGGRRDLSLPGWSVHVAKGPGELQQTWRDAVQLAAANGEQPVIFWRVGHHRWRCAWSAASHVGGMPSRSVDACLQSDPLTWATMNVRQPLSECCAVA